MFANFVNQRNSRTFPTVYFVTSGNAYYFLSTDIGELQTFPHAKRLEMQIHEFFDRIYQLLCPPAKKRGYIVEMFANFVKHRKSRRFPIALFCHIWQGILLLKHWYWRAANISTRETSRNASSRSLRHVNIQLYSISVIIKGMMIFGLLYFRWDMWQTLFAGQPRVRSC